MTNKKIFFLLIVIIFFSVLIRFYNFPHRVTFWSEQARSLITASDNFRKPSLLGQEYFVRHDSYGRVLFAGALFSYLLVPILYFTQDVVVITAAFAVLNVATGLVIYLVAKKIFGIYIALLSITIFLFNDTMIYHSLFIWIYNFLPLIGILSLYLLFLYFIKPKNIYAFFLGLLSGFGISLQILFAPTALIVAAIMLWKKTKIRAMALVCFVFGVVLTNLPMIIFDFRHGFYHVRTFLQYSFDSIKGTSNAGIVYYHFLQFWPIFAIILALLIVAIYRHNKTMATLFLMIYLLVNVISPKIDFNKPTGTPGKLYAYDLDRVSQKIAQDANGNFNVASLLDFDKQAYTLRYFVGYKYGKQPLGVEDYPKTTILYVLAEKGYNFQESGVWEINSGGPYKISQFVSIDAAYAIYKLTK